MKPVTAAVALIAGVLFNVQAQAHHAAEGIISDDLWQMIDDRLEDADSPHLDLDFTMMDNAIITTIEVDTSLVDEMLTTISSVNQGRLLVATQPTAPDLTEIIVVEPIGIGESQIIYQ